MPFLKIANQVFQGETTRMIGDEIIFGRIRSESTGLDCGYMCCFALEG